MANDTGRVAVVTGGSGGIGRACVERLAADGFSVLIHFGGATATPLFFEGKSQEVVDRIADANPMQRLGTPEDIAETVSFLAGPARWVNGQVLHTNGAMA